MIRQPFEEELEVTYVATMTCPSSNRIQAGNEAAKQVGSEFATDEGVDSRVTCCCDEGIRFDGVSEN